MQPLAVKTLFSANISALQSHTTLNIAALCLFVGNFLLSDHNDQESFTPRPLFKPFQS